MDVLTSTEGQTGLPRYFASVFSVSKALKHGRLDFVMPDGRRFRVDGPNPGPVGEIVVKDGDVFARLIRIDNGSNSVRPVPSLITIMPLDVNAGFRELLYTR